MSTCRYALIALLSLVCGEVLSATTEFCLDGEYDLGGRYQGLYPRSGEFYPARWCVVTEDDSDRVHLSVSGQSNPDMDGSWTVAFIPPDLVRIINAGLAPDIEFTTAKSIGEAARTRRMDPRRVAEELAEGKSNEFVAKMVDGRLVRIETMADLPLRGRVLVTWRWDWDNPEAPELKLYIEEAIVFRGVGSWRTLNDSSSFWQPKPGEVPVEVPEGYWPARVAMKLVNLSEHIYFVKNVRTGFQHLVVDTAEGLVVADAPAGWVELYQVPPEDLVPGLGISGLSERLIDFLSEKFPGRPVRAVALTHHHDDHAGGARAFAAVGAEIYAPTAVAGFLEDALNRDSMPDDRLSSTGGRVSIRPVAQKLQLLDERLPIDIVPIGGGPHAVASLGILAGGWFFQSDLHVPDSDTDEPRVDRSEIECWFAEWAITNLPKDTVVINTHSPWQTPISRFARYLESPQCSDTIFSE